jgi:phosphopantothenoylcysteine decarboxylase/phosphopantothenate--cysteine ligase
MVPVTTAQQMRSAVLRAFPRTNFLIMAAAVADYRPAQAVRSKIKKTGNRLMIPLVRNPDILGEILKQRKPGQWVLGFAAETDQLKTRAGEKWSRKPCDLLAANRVGPGRVFGTDKNELLVFSRFSVQPVKIGPASKARVAEELLDLADQYMKKVSKG